MKINTFSRTMVCGLVIAFFLLPINKVYADGYSSDANYWRWWYIEHTTDDITNGSGASAENIQDTDSGQTAGTVIYNQSGVTRGDFIDYVEEQYNQAEGYIQNGVDYYVDAVNHVYDSTVTAATKAAYGTQKAVREVVDASGNVIVDVSGSDFWHSAYNSLFNNNGYKDQYTQNADGSYDVTVDNVTYNLTYYGFGNAYGNLIEGTTNVYDSVNIGLSNQDLQNQHFIYKVSSGSKTGYVNCSRGWYIDAQWQVDRTNIFNEQYSYDNNYVRCSFNFYGSNHTTVWDDVAIATFNNNISSGQNSTTPVLQPKQCGFIVYNGDRVPVYTDTTQNPFTINPDGTVNYNGNTYPIYVDPDEISPDGWLKILEFIDNEDETQNPYNPQGQPWNTQNDGSVLGGFFSNLITDIGNLFNNIVDIFKNLIEKLINAIKGLFDMDYNSLDSVELEVNFNVIQDIINNLLEYLGVT